MNFQLKYIQEKYQPEVDRLNNAITICRMLSTDPILSQDNALVRFMEEKASELIIKRNNIWKQWQKEHRHQEEMSRDENN